jgi:hypothetical protein
MGKFYNIPPKLPVVVMFTILLTITLFFLASCGEHGITTAGHDTAVSLYSSEPDIDLSPTSMYFCEVEYGSSNTFVLTISNNATELPLQINSLIFVEGYEFCIHDPPPIPSIILPGESLQIPITFRPLLGKIGYALLQIGSNDPDEPEVLVYMGGNGLSQITSPEDQIVKPGKSAPNRLNAFTNMIKTAGSYIEEDDFEKAAGQLDAAYHKTDELLNPPDFVTGEATQPLAQMILCLSNDLENAQQ